MAEQSYITNAEGSSQVRFVEKGCYNEEEIYCNLYEYYWKNKRIFGLDPKYIEINAQNNILILDTIKLYK